MGTRVIVVAKFRLVVLLLVLTALQAAAQTTRVRGTVTDAESGEPLPFVSVYFDGTTIGISTDLEGKFSLETRSADAKVLTAHIVGYASQSYPVSPGFFNEIDFRLKVDPDFLEAAMVKPDDRYIKSILRQIDQRRKNNNPDKEASWQTGLYSKIELDATNMEDLLSLGILKRNFDFVQNYADTSAITGKPFIPIMISESVSDLYHSSNPSFEREIMRANRISGLDDDNFLRQFTGSYFLKTNFYEANIGVFNLEIPSPSAASSHIFYNYYLVDSLQVDGRKTYTLRFHPKRFVTSPVFDGEMQIDAEDFGIRSAHVALASEANVNWIRHINIDVENRRLPDGRWFYGEENLFADFSIAVSDSSRIVSFLGRRHQVYDLPEYGEITDPDVLASQNRVVLSKVQPKDDVYWEENRPYELSSREKGIYKMVDEVKENTLYKWGFALANSMFTGYYEVPEIGIGFGRWARTVVYNETEGLRLQAGFRTMRDFSEKVRLTGTLAYGFRDKTPKWSFKAEFMFNREKTRMLTVSAKKDFVQLGSGSGIFSAQNMFTSVVARSHMNRQSMVREFALIYDHEWSPSVNQVLQWRTSRLWGNPLVPLVRADGSPQESFLVNELSTSLRFSWDERVNRGFFRKYYLFTRFPVISVDLIRGFDGITPDSYGYWREELTFQWNIPSTAIGFGKLFLNGGAIQGSVPYTLLKLHEGNQTFFIDRAAFSCMNYYEFASDRWLSGYYEHNFNGLLLGKLPLIKKLDLREVASVRFAWGTLSPQNRERAPFQLPLDMHSLEIPYVEAGVGISNIFRVLRVDAVWRLTHPREESDKNFTINIGFDVEF